MKALPAFQPFPAFLAFLAFQPFPESIQPFVDGPNVTDRDQTNH